MLIYPSGDSLSFTQRLGGRHVGKYLLRRLIFLVWILIAVSIICFMIIHLLPGSPSEAILGTGWTPQGAALLNKQLGLDQPLIMQYLTWLGHVLTLNFGQDYITQTSIASTLKVALPPTIELVVLSQLISLGLAIPVATFAALRPNKLFDKLANLGSFGLLSVPTYVIITLLYIPITQWLNVPNSGTASYVPMSQGLLTNLESLLIPIVALSIGSFVVYFRVFRADLISTLQEEYITMARSKGISRRRILFRHAYRPSSVALISTIGVNMAGLVTGTFIAEQVAAVPGIGSSLVGAIFQPDYQLLQAIVLVTATIVIVVNFGLDLLTGYIDPRISRD